MSLVGRDQKDLDHHSLFKLDEQIRLLIYSTKARSVSSSSIFFYRSMAYPPSPKSNHSKNKYAGKLGEKGKDGPTTKGKERDI